MSTHSWIEQIQNLPVLPQVAMRVTERMQSPTSTLQEVSDLIKSDIGLSSKILRLANSSYYSIPGGVSEVSKALQYLGFTTIAQVVLTSSVFGSFKTQGSREFPLNQFWIHSFAVGQLAEIAARTLKISNPADAFIGGLLHDVGKLILLELAPDQLSKIVRHAKEQNLSFIQAEAALGFSNHIELGLQLARHWKLPPVILSAIQFHHDGAKTPDVMLIEWANLWVHVHHFGASGNYDSDLSPKLESIEKRLQITNEASKLIETHFNKEFEKAGAILSGH